MVMRATQKRFFYILLFGLFIQMYLLGIMEKGDYPWSTEVKANNKYEEEFRKKYPSGGFYINLGPTGIRAQIMTDKPDQFLVKYVFQDAESPAKGKIVIGDIIVGANGKGFATHHFGRMRVRGWGGPVMDLSKAIEDSQGKDGILKLTVLKGGQSKTTVDLQLKPLGRFSPDYPNNCKRSEEMARRLCDNIADTFSGGRIGRPHVNAQSLLALMAHGYKDHEKIVKKIVSGYAKKRYSPLDGGFATWGWGFDGFATWGWGFDGVVMGEYTHLYKDKSLKKAMESVAEAYVEGSKGTGIFTHRSLRALDKMGRSPYASIAGISGLAMLSLSMIKRAEYDYSEDFYNVIHQHYLNASTPDCLGIAYGFGNNAPNLNRKGIEPRHAIIRVTDLKKGLSGKGIGYECPTGMKDIGEYEIMWPTKSDPRWKPLDWLKDEIKSNKVFEVNINKGSMTGKGFRRVVRNHPDYKEPKNAEPKKPYNTSKAGFHCLPIGLGAVAHMIDPEGRKSWEYLGRHAANTVALAYENAFDGHGGGNLHAFWTTVGAGFADEKKKRAYLDYLKCFLIMGETHYGHMIVQPLSRDRPGGNGDPFYGAISLPTATAAILLSLNKKRLLITGAADGSPAMVSNYKRSGKGAQSIRKAAAMPKRQPIKLTVKQKEKLDMIMLATLLKLNRANELKQVPLTISKTKKSVWLAKVDSKAILTFQLTKGKKQVGFEFKDLTNSDKMILSRLIAVLKPQSKVAQALAGLYIEAGGNGRMAANYFKKSNSESIKKIESLLKVAL